MGAMSSHDQAPLSSLVITCEHGGYQVPRYLWYLFENKEELLKSHRGWDPGALELAQQLSAELHVPLFFEEVSRLVVEQNRSRDGSEVFSEITSRLPESEKDRLLRYIYDPYHQRVEEQICKISVVTTPVIHLSIHTFTPELDGHRRSADIGLLYDPLRNREEILCFRLKQQFEKLNQDLCVRFNYPYSGTADGFTTCLRQKYGHERYCGIELEINQEHYFNKTEIWCAIRKSLSHVIMCSIGKP